jgi:hypothetical protein
MAIPRAREEDHIPLGRLVHEQLLVVPDDETRGDCKHRSSQMLI